MLSSADKEGGAARAAFRLHDAYLNSGISSRMKVANKQSDLTTIESPITNLGKVSTKTRSILGISFQTLQATKNNVRHSAAFLPSGIVNEINKGNADVVNLHWVCNEFLSISDIAKIQKPLVWTMHDMWAFCGSEHYVHDNESTRWQQGYSKTNRPDQHRGLDIDRWTWNRKKKLWKNPIHIVAPSHWLADCVRSSLLMKDWPVSVIPYSLDLEKYHPWPKTIARKILNIPVDKPLVLFGAMDGISDTRKGWSFLQEALELVSADLPSAELVILGQSEPKEIPDIGLPIHWLGRLYDDVSLSLVYAAVDVFVLPSIQDNLPLTGVEAQACGCPVVAFDCSGLPDVVEHGVTGYLAKPFESSDLAAGIRWVIDNPARKSKLGRAARDRALRLWSPDVVVSKYMDLFNLIMA